MNEEIKKHLRTQGKYSEKGQRKEKWQNIPKEPLNKKTFPQKRNSGGRKEESASFPDLSENESPVKYEENSSYLITELQDEKKPIEIKLAGIHILSETENGRSSVLYEPDFMSEAEASYFLYQLYDSTIWNEKNIVIRGAEYSQPRLVAWYGPLPYSYSGVVLEPAEMPDDVLQVKNKIETYLRKHDINVTFNSVLLNCYRDGKDSVAWHSDDELSMGVCPTIASISLGQTRKFEMRKKVQYFDEDEPDEFFINLTHGSILVMTGSMQDVWQHRVPKEYHHKRTRINMTFRTVYSLDKSPSQASANNPRKSSNYAKNLPDRCRTKDEAMFDDGDFPQLGDSMTSPACSKTGDELHDKSQNSDTSSKNEDGLDKSAEYVDGNTNVDPCMNNLNHGQNFKHDIPNKNVYGCDNTSNDNGNADKSDSLNYYTADDHMDDSIDSSSNTSERNIFRNNRGTSCSSDLNVNAAEFVPINSVTENSEKIDFSCPLEDLIFYNFVKFDSVTLKNYTFALIDAIEEIQDDLYNYEYDEFRFLLDLTDGTQTDKNQKLIVNRMCFIIERHFENRKKKPARYGNRSRYHQRGNRVSDSYNSGHNNEARKSQENQRENSKSYKGRRY